MSVLQLDRHPWCSDPARDESVRAAEDNRTGPPPTLEEAIGEPFADSLGASDTDRLRADADHLLSLVHGQTKDFGELLEVVGRISSKVERLEGMMAKSGSGSSGPDQQNKGERMGTNGLRTERVTLEVTHNCRFPLKEWLLDMVADVTSDPGESVRVVEEADRLEVRLSGLQAAVESARDERDAAIRERDTLREERITQALTADRFAAAVIDVDKLRARVAELESCDWVPKAAPAASGAAGTEPVAWGDISAARLAKMFHTFYENLAPAFGYETRKDTREFNPESTNGRLMVAVCNNIIGAVDAPQPASGWLTAEERRLIEGMMESASAFPPTMHWHSGLSVRETLRVMEALLARSSPPEVVLPVSWTETNHINRVMSAKAVIAAIAAAGVTWKEVGN